MSQTPPEPTEPTEQTEQTSIPNPITPAVDIPDEATIVVNPVTAPSPEAGIPVTQAQPGDPIRFGGPAGPDWRQSSLALMQKSQELTAKWLYDLGGWVFGGLIVAALMLLQDLISLGFADRATLIAGLAIALALPFNLAGLGTIRYFNTLNQAVEEARLALGQASNLDAAALTRLTRETEAFPPGKHQVMDFTVSLSLYLSLLFTIIGLGSALWRISWAATLLFLIASAISLFLVLRVIRYS